MTLIVAALTVALVLELLTEYLPQVWPNARVIISVVLGALVCWHLGESPAYGPAAAYLGFALTTYREYLLLLRDEKEFGIQKMTRRRPIPGL